MSERKNIKLRQESYELLKEQKNQYETWDGMIHRLFGEETGLQCPKCDSTDIVTEDMGPSGTAFKCAECDCTLQVG